MKSIEKIKLLILERMMTVHKDTLDDIHVMADLHGFYDFEELSGLEKNEYASLLKNMRHEGLIEINLNNDTSFKFANIEITKAGVQYAIKKSAGD